VPLDKSCAVDAVSKNISAEMKDGGKPQSQAIAIALSTLRRSCGVPDDGKKMSAKEIVAAGGKKEGTFIRLAALIERQAPADIDAELWLSKLSEAAQKAVKEAGRWGGGPHTTRLLGLVDDFVQRRTHGPTFEEVGTRNPGSERWLEWVTRVSLASENRALPELSVLIRRYHEGLVAIPSGTKPRFHRMMEKFGIDFATRSSLHGVGTSPSAAKAPSEPYTSYAAGADIVSGDGRAPVVPSKRKTAKKR